MEGIRRKEERKEGRKEGKERETHFKEKVKRNWARGCWIIGSYVLGQQREGASVSRS